MMHVLLLLLLLLFSSSVVCIHVFKYLCVCVVNCKSTDVFKFCEISPEILLLALAIII